MSDEGKIRRLQRAIYSRTVADKLKPRERHALHPIGHAIAPDWSEEGADPVSESTVAPRAITLTRSALWWLLGAAVVFFLFSAGAFVYYFTVGPGGESAAPRNIDIAIRGPLTVIGGEPAQLQIIVTNRNPTALELADLVIRYPEGTRSVSDFQTPLRTLREPLGSIEPGGVRQGTVPAVFMGAEGEHKTIIVELEYRIKDSSAIFVADAEYEITFATSPATVSIEANEEAISGQRMIIMATVSSNAEVPIKDVLLQVEYPFGFTLAEATPEANEQGNFWVIGDLNPGDQRAVRIEGTLEGQEGDERVFHFTLGTREKKDVVSVDSALSVVQHRVAIERPFIALSVVPNKNSDGVASAVAPGQFVNVSIPWKNNLPSAITDLVIVAQISGVALNGRDIRVQDGFYRSSDSTIIWDKATTQGDFAKVEAGEAGSVNFSFQVPSADTIASERNPQVAVVANAAARRAEGNVPETLQSSASYTMKIGTKMAILSEAFYHLDPGRSGPLPPKVHEETTYAVVWSVANTTNKVTGASITGVLPPNVRWLGQFTEGERYTYNGEDGTITWHIGDLEPGIGVGGTDPRSVFFRVGLTPSTSQVGDTPPILVQQVFRATDTFAETEITESMEDLTTDLRTDAGFIPDEGKVVQ